MIDDNRALSIGNVRDQCAKYNDLYGRNGNYIELAYIETDGNQLIDTGYIPNQNTRVKTGIYLPIQDSYPRCFFGGRNEPTKGHPNASFTLWALSMSSYQIEYGSVNTTISLRPVGYPDIDINKNTSKINILTATQSTQTFKPTATMHIFGVNSSQYPATGDNRRLKCTFFYLDIYENDVPVRKFVPARNGNVVGLLDKVTGTFYENVGSGSFVAGPDRIIPKEYNELLYIEAVGTSGSNGPYIDTKLKPTDEVYVVSKFRYLDGITWGHGCLFGERTSANATGHSNRFSFGYSLSSTSWRYDYGSSNTSIEFNDFQTDEYYGAYRSVCALRDGSIITGDSGTFTANYDLYLFAANTAGTHSLGANARIYFFYIKTGTGSRFFIPAKNKSTGKIGMYDLVTREFYGNANTYNRDFIAGPEINQYGFPNLNSVNQNDNNAALLGNTIGLYTYLATNSNYDNHPISSYNLKYILTKYKTYEKSIQDKISSENPEIIYEPPEA